VCPDDLAHRREPRDRGGANLQHVLEAIDRFDRDITWALRSFADAHPWLTAPVIVMTALAIFGSAASVVLLCRARPRLRGPLAAASAVIVAYAGSDAVGMTWYRPRPFVAMQVSPLYPHSANSSFPSGTVAVVAAVATVAFFAWPVLGRMLAAATVMVAFGCVYVDVHYASDVAVGALAGAVSAAVTWRVSGLSWPSTLLTAADRYAARLGARIRASGQPDQQRRQREADAGPSHPGDAGAGYVEDLRNRHPVRPRMRHHLGLRAGRGAGVPVAAQDPGAAEVVHVGVPARSYPRTGHDAQPRPRCRAGRAPNMAGAARGSGRRGSIRRASSGSSAWASSAQLAMASDIRSPNKTATRA
jgi:undecaprenyl-diphosphatase